MGFLGLAPSGIKMLFLGLLTAAVAAVGIYIMVLRGDLATAQAQVGALQTAKAVQDTTIKVQGGALQDWKKWSEGIKTTLDSVAKAQQEANAYTRKLNDVLSQHDLKALSLGKPGLIEPRINSGTADVLRMLRSASGRDGNAGGHSPPAGNGAPAGPAAP
jgi:hypothetical protein